MLFAIVVIQWLNGNTALFTGRHRPGPIELSALRATIRC
jgi:hypothetical protein